MNIFTRLLLLKKEIRVNKIPEELLQHKSGKNMYSNVSLYYYENGNKILSVFDESVQNEKEKDTLGVIRVLNTLHPYFHFCFDNIFISKSEEKLLGFSYPLDYGKTKYYGRKFDLKKLVDEIASDVSCEELKEYLIEKDTFSEFQAKSNLISTIFLYKVLKYLNKNKISVKDLTIEDILLYKENPAEKYIQMQNSITKLDLCETLDEKEEHVHITNLCINYFSRIRSRSLYSYEFIEFINKFSQYYTYYGVNSITDDKLSFLENADLETVFYNQFKNIKVFLCGNDCEHDKEFFRCPWCGDRDIIHDKVLDKTKISKIHTTNVLKVEDSDLKIYYKDSNIFLMFDENTDAKERKENLRKYFLLLDDERLLYSILYNSKIEVIGLEIKINRYYSSIDVSNINEYFEDLFLSKASNPNLFFENFVSILTCMAREIKDMYTKGLILNVDDICDYQSLVDCFFTIDFRKYSQSIGGISVKPTKLRETTNEQHNIENFDIYKYTANIVCNILFNICKKTFGSRIENGFLISDKFDVINLLNLQIVSEYKKFLNGQVYDFELVLKLLEKTDINEDYDMSYVVSPEKFNSVLISEIDEKELRKKYVFVKKGICNEEKLLNLEEISQRKDNKIQVILPKYIVYKLERGLVEYAGYFILKTNIHYVCDVFKISNLKKSIKTNKDILKMLITYYKKIVDKSLVERFPVEFLCYDKNMEKILAYYRPIKERNNSIFGSAKNKVNTEKYFFDEIIPNIKETNIYLSDAIFSMENFPHSKETVAKLNKVYESFTNFCETHNSFYENILTRCPICNKFYEFVDTNILFGNIAQEYENEFYRLFEYKSNIMLKIYKTIDGEHLINGKKITEIEDEVISLLESKKELIDLQEIIKIVKDSNTEKTIGVLILSKMSLGSMSVRDTLLRGTNYTNLKVAKALIKHFNQIKHIFENINSDSKKQIEECLKYNLFYQNDVILACDFEIIKKKNVNNNLNVITKLAKVIKYILSYDERCYDFGSISFPKADNNYLSNMRIIIDELLNYYDKNNTSVAFCSKHNVYYNCEDGMCPLCANEMEDYWIFKKEERGKQVNVGGEALIYTLGLSQLVKTYTKGNIRETQSGGNTDELRKLLDEHFEKKMKERESVLSVMKNFYTSTQKDIANRDFIIVFPKKMFYGFKNKTFFGFVQDKVLDAVSMSIFTNKLKCQELGFTTPHSLLRILIGFGDGIEYLHNSPEIRKILPDGVVLGDVSGRNALYSKYHDKVAIIDMDSVGIKGYPCYTYTEEYIDPLIKKKEYPDNHLTFESDWYSYAIICFYILTKVHPFEGNLKDGRKMSISERKEAKISILGKDANQIILPNVVEKWDWMPDYLTSAFVDIFENEKRYSILGALKKAYNEITGTCKYVEIENCHQTILNCDSVENNECIKVIQEETKVENRRYEIIGYLRHYGVSINSLDILLDDYMAYYKNRLEKKILCSDQFERYGLSYVSQDNFIRRNGYAKFEEVYVRDGKGIATQVTDEGSKVIGIVNNLEFTGVYKMSDASRTFKILHDSINDNYLLINTNGGKSYIVSGNSKAVINYYDIYSVKIEELESFEHEHFEENVAYVGNAIYIAEDGYITRLNLKNGTSQQIECEFAKKDAKVKVFSDAIIIVTDNKIIRIKK